MLPQDTTLFLILFLQGFSTKLEDKGSSLDESIEGGTTHSGLHILKLKFNFFGDEAMFFCRLFTSRFFKSFSRNRHQNFFEQHCRTNYFILEEIVKYLLSLNRICFGIGFKYQRNGRKLQMPKNLKILEQLLSTYIKDMFKNNPSGNLQEMR